jgi:hypothetical protein
MVLFVARTFLPRFGYAQRERWNSLLHHKINQKSGKSKIGYF